MGLMRYKRLNFGISSAAEIFQNMICETLEGIDGTINISDDKLVFGKTHSEHNWNLRAVFQRLREKGLTLNKSKCEYSKDKLEFSGYMFSKDSISPDPKKVELRGQSSNAIDSVRGAQPTGDDKLLFKVHPGLCHQDGALAQAYSQGPTVVLDSRARPLSQPAERGTGECARHRLF